MQPRAGIDTPARRDAATATFLVARREWEQVRAGSLALAGAPVAASARKSRAAGWGWGSARGVDGWRRDVDPRRAKGRARRSPTRCGTKGTRGGKAARRHEG
jgi:hypothetical protein